MNLFATFFRDMWRGLVLMFAILPLRAVTGRRHPDYRRIAELELALGMREPMNIIEELSGISCPVPGIGYTNIEQGLTTINEARTRGSGPGQPKWVIEPSRSGVISGPPPRPRPRPAEPAPPRRSRRETDYERGQQIGEDILAHLGHDHEQIDVTAIGDREPVFIRGRCLNTSDIRSTRHNIWEQAKLIIDGATGRSLTTDEQAIFDMLNRRLDEIDLTIRRLTGG